MSDEPNCYLYRAFDAEGILLYAGISVNAITRLGQHMTGSAWWELVTEIRVEKYATRADALEAETKVIEVEKPLHNVAGGRRSIDPAVAEARRLEREQEEREIAEWQAKHWFAYRAVVCMNCGHEPGNLRKGVLVSEHECPNCECVTLRLRKPVEVGTEATND
jgi:predicted GIY-YIG superfamily endonuclease